MRINNHPIIIDNPPKGVIGPRILEIGICINSCNVIAYIDPEKRITPSKINQNEGLIEKRNNELIPAKAKSPIPLNN